MTQLIAVRTRFLSRICPPPSIVWRRRPCCSSRPRRCWGQTLTLPPQGRSSLRAPEVSKPSVNIYIYLYSLPILTSHWQCIMEINVLPVSIYRFDFFSNNTFRVYAFFKYSLIPPLFNFFNEMCKIILGH